MKKYITIAMMILALILTCERVKADTMYDSHYYSYYSDANKTLYFGSDTANFQYFNLSLNNNNVSQVALYLSENVEKGDYDYLTFDTMVTGRPYGQTTNNDSEIVCDWRLNGSTYEAVNCRDMCSITNTCTTITYYPIEFRMTVYITGTKNGQPKGTQCQLNNNLITCPLESDTTYNALILSYNLTNNSSGNNAWRWHISHYVNRYIDTSQTQKNIENELKKDHEYNNNASENLNGQNDLDTYTNTEDQLMQSIDLDSADTSEISINANTSTFIWNIANLLRGIHAKIVLLMTSILGIGIMKLILNR